MTRPPNAIDESTYAGRLGAAIRKRRLKARLTVAAAATLAGAPLNTWYHWEDATSPPRIEDLPRIAVALRCCPRGLMP